MKMRKTKQKIEQKVEQIKSLVDELAEEINLDTDVDVNRGIRDICQAWWELWFNIRYFKKELDFRSTRNPKFF
jgi:hypothetical protein